MHSRALNLWTFSGDDITGTVDTTAGGIEVNEFFHIGD